jgi:hypothetical protein
LFRVSCVSAQYLACCNSARPPVSLSSHPFAKRRGQPCATSPSFLSLLERFSCPALPSQPCSRITGQCAAAPTPCPRRSRSSWFLHHRIPVVRVCCSRMGWRQWAGGSLVVEFRVRSGDRRRDECLTGACAIALRVQRETPTPIREVRVSVWGIEEEFDVRSTLLLHRAFDRDRGPGRRRRRPAQDGASPQPLSAVQLVDSSDTL